MYKFDVIVINVERKSCYWSGIIKRAVWIKTRANIWHSTNRQQEQVCLLVLRVADIEIRGFYLKDWEDLRVAIGKEIRGYAEMNRMSYEN